jgi:hypothetical protein
MKNILIFLVFLLPSVSFGQVTINRQIVEAPPYKVGDVITIRYNINAGTESPRYLWVRYQYNNKILIPVPNSTVYSQGTSVQTYSTEWVNFRFFPQQGVASTSLYEQYQLTPWDYRPDQNWNVGQLTIQRTDNKIDGDFVSQKFTVRENVSYEDIHQLSIAYAIGNNSQFIAPVTTPGTQISLGTVTGGSSSFKVKVAFPANYTNIVDHNVQLMKLKTDNSGDIDWSQPPIAQLPLDATGEAVFTTQVKVGDEVGVFVSPAFQKAFMNDIITVSDAYKAFLGHSQTDIAGTPNFFTYPNLENKVGNITLQDNTFNESDSYFLFAYIMGIDVSQSAMIPSATASSVRWMSGLLNQSWLDGTPKHKVVITSNNQIANAVFAWGGDLNWSHSTDPAVIAQNIQNNTNVTNRVNTPTHLVGSYQPKQFEEVKLGVTSRIEAGKVTLSTDLQKDGLAGLELIIKYDESKLQLDRVEFDTGNTITNFWTNDNGRLTFGSIDQIKSSKIKKGTPYKLIFTPKVTLTSTTGLFYFVLTDAVDANGTKINLIIE